MARIGAVGTAEASALPGYDGGDFVQKIGQNVAQNHARVEDVAVQDVPVPRGGRGSAKTTGGGGEGERRKSAVVLRTPFKLK